MQALQKGVYYGINYYFIFEMIKLVVTDLDGTLLDDNKKINDEFWDVEKELAARGIFFCAASGRQYYSILTKFEHIRDRVYFIAENGTFVIYKNEVIHREALDKKESIKFAEIARQIKDVHIVYCCENSAYIESNDERFNNEVVKYYKRIEKVKDVTEVDDVLLKFSLCDFGGAEQNSLPLYRTFEKDYKIAIAGKYFLDITHPKANKGTAIAVLQQKLGITQDETLVIGDYPNDLEMLDMAKYNFAMKNAHPEILRKASFVTEYDNNNNGAVETIKKYCLNGQMT